MIYTKIGTPIKIIKKLQKQGFVTIKRINGGQKFDIHITDLKADGGFEEVHKAIDGLK